VQDQVGTARAERRLYTECAAGQEASAEHLTLSGDMVKFLYFAAFKT